MHNVGDVQRSGWQRAVFLDRDGTINANRSDYVKSPEEFHFLPGATTALRLLARLELEIIVVTNQSAIGRGIISLAMANEINLRMIEQIWRSGGRVTQVYICPHTPVDRCACRKPRPGLLLQAAKEYRLDLHRSFMVGDRASDVEAAQAVGCRPILICGDKQEVPNPLGPAIRVVDLCHAVRCIQKELKMASDLSA